MIFIPILFKKIRCWIVIYWHRLTYEIKLEKVYEEFFKWKDLFDFCNYSNDSKFFDKTSKKVIGQM